MRKLSLSIAVVFLAILLCACGATQPVATPPPVTPSPTPPPPSDLEVYSEVLRDNAGNGYLLKDMDGDGTNELLIGPLEGDEYHRQLILAMYTMEDYSPVEVFSGGEDDEYYLCENGSFDEKQAPTTTRITHNYYYYASGEMKLLSSLEYGPGVDRVCRWSLTEAGIASEVDEDTAMSYISTYENTYVTPQYEAIS